MKSLSEFKAVEMTGLSYDCSCGRTHSVDIDGIMLGSGVLDKVVKSVEGYRGKKLLLAADSNTYKAAGQKVRGMLENAGFDLEVLVFRTEKHDLIPNAYTIGRLLVGTPADTSLIVAVGSGVINDISRYVSYRLGCPYIIVATAPSMDGYPSVVTPLVVDNNKITFDAKYPDTIIGDTDVLIEAPDEMLRAGFGDIIGKITALSDWKLSSALNQEHYCEECVSLVRKALDKCLENRHGLMKRKAEAIEYVMEALLLSGLAIGLYGNSRPASGAEHNFAHYWDVDAVRNRRVHPLHGNSVAAGTVVTAHVYNMVKDFLPEDVPIPDPDEITGYLEDIGAVSSPYYLGIGKELFKRSIHNAMDLKDRYTVFHFARDNGMLDEIAETLEEIFY